MARFTPTPQALRLPAGPLLAAVDHAAHGRETTVVRLLGRTGQKAYYRVRQAGTVTLRQVEDLCDRLGCHPFELYGQAYQQLALAAVPGPLEAEVTVTAWHAAICARPGCGRPIRPGELVGLVGEVGACCAACCGLDSPMAPAPRALDPRWAGQPHPGRRCPAPGSAAATAAAATPRPREGAA
jgi:hypothetical protein